MRPGTKMRPGESAEHEPVLRELETERLQSCPIPARIQVPDLAGADLDAVVMEVVAEVQVVRLLLIETDRDDGSAPADDAHGLVTGARAARALERDGEATGRSFAAHT